MDTRMHNYLQDLVLVLYIHAVFFFLSHLLSSSQRAFVPFRVHNHIILGSEYGV